MTCNHSRQSECGVKGLCLEDFPTASYGDLQELGIAKSLVIVK